MIELAQQLAVIMVGKQIINNAKEMIIPMLKTWWQKKKVRFTGLCKKGKKSLYFPVKTV